MSYHVEKTRFDELPAEIVVREDGYLYDYRNFGTPIVDYIYVRSNNVCHVASVRYNYYGGEGCDTYRFRFSCGHSIELIEEDEPPNYCPECGAKIWKGGSE